MRRPTVEPGVVFLHKVVFAEKIGPRRAGIQLTSRAERRNAGTAGFLKLPMAYPIGNPAGRLEKRSGPRESLAGF
jgi:hypothetical protein